jgi:hypothetical protein
MSGWSELAGNREMLAKGKWRRQICVRHIKPQRRRESTNRRVVQRGKGSPKSVALFRFWSIPGGVAQSHLLPTLWAVRGARCWR